MNLVTAVAGLFSRSDSRSRARAAGSLENPAVSLTDPSTWSSLLGGAATDSGETINHYTALTLAPVHQAVSIISGDAAGVALHLYQHQRNGDRELQLSDSREMIVNRVTNEETAAFDFWRRLYAHALLYSNGYAYIWRENRTGRPIGMYNLLPDRTCPTRDRKGRLFYVTEVDGRPETLLAEEVFHLKGLSLEPGLGLDLVLSARNAIGLALAAEKFSSRFFKHGAHAGGILEIPASFTEKAADNLDEGFRKRLGSDNWFRTIVLRDGAKFHQAMVDAEKSQLHELREDQVRDVARFFNLPPHKLGVADSQSYNSTEQSQLQYLTGTLWHWLKAGQGEANLKLLTNQELRDGTHCFDHDVEDVARPDVKTTEEILEIRRRNEIINANEWRRKIRMPRRKDAGGDKYENPNTKSSNAPPKPEEEGDESGDESARRRNTAAQRRLIELSAARFARRVSGDLERLAAKPEKLLAWIDTKGQAHRAAFREQLETVIEAAAAALGQENHEATYLAVEGRFFALALEMAEGAVSSATAEQLPGKIRELAKDFALGASREMVSNVLGEAGGDTNFERAA